MWGPEPAGVRPPTGQNMTQNMWAHPVRAHRAGKGYWEGYWEADWACLVQCYLYSVTVCFFSVNRKLAACAQPDRI